MEWLTDDGLASSEPAIRPGCVVVAVQGTSLQGIGYQDALARVKDASRPLQLTFEEPAAAMETSDAMPEARPDLPPYLIYSPLCATRSSPSSRARRRRSTAIATGSGLDARGPRRRACPSLAAATC